MTDYLKADFIPSFEITISQQEKIQLLFVWLNCSINDRIDKWKCDRIGNCLQRVLD